MNEDETLYQSDDNFNLSLAQMKLLDILGHYPETTDVNIAKSVGYRYYRGL
jgi:predicted RNA-binding protein with PIN domain